MKVQEYLHRLHSGRIVGSNSLKGKVITQIITGAQSSMALDSTGSIFSWGSNNFGQVHSFFHISSNYMYSIFNHHSSFVKWDWYCSWVLVIELQDILQFLSTMNWFLEEYSNQFLFIITL
jgi:hypothetical protein